MPARCCVPCCGKMSLRFSVFIKRQFKMEVERSGPRFNIKTISYRYRKYHCRDKTILWPSYLHDGISYTGKTTSLYWIAAQIEMGSLDPNSQQQSCLSEKLCRVIFGNIFVAYKASTELWIEEFNQFTLYLIYGNHVNFMLASLE